MMKRFEGYTHGKLLKYSIGSTVIKYKAPILSKKEENPYVKRIKDG